MRLLVFGLGYMDSLEEQAVGTERDSERCLICLNPFEEQTVGTLQSCQHIFCLDCILQWSMNVNSCPVDRMGFSVIYQRGRIGGDIQKQIRVKKRRQVVEEEEEGPEHVICEECGRSDRGHQLVLCADCDSGYHTDCLTPQLDTSPARNWCCPECAAISANTGGTVDGAAAEEEVSDGEVMDLLADAVPTASRLRTSTIGQTSTSATARRSERVHTRTTRKPLPPPYTLLHVPKYLLKSSWTVETTNELVAGNHGDTCVGSTNQVSPPPTSTCGNPRPVERRRNR